MNNSERQSSPSTSSSTTENSHPVSLPLFLTTSSSSLKPLRERNRTNSKRRIKLSRSQVLSNDFENEESIPTVKNIQIHKTIGTTINSSITTAATTTTTAIGQSSTISQLTPSTPNPVYNELCSKVLSPTTPSPIHNKVTCSQVWERLTSHEDVPTMASPLKLEVESNIEQVLTSTTNIPTHISFSYDKSDDEDEDEQEKSPRKNDFQYVPLNSQSKLVQCQFLTFARQQTLLFSTENDNDSDATDSNDSENENDEDDLVEDFEFDLFQSAQNQENHFCKKRKRSTSDSESIEKISSIQSNQIDSNNKQPKPKKVKTKDPNANFQRLNMRKKNFSHAKKHQFSKNKRNAFYRRMKNAAANR